MMSRPISPAYNEAELLGLGAQMDTAVRTWRAFTANPSAAGAEAEDDLFDAVTVVGEAITASTAATIAGFAVKSKVAASALPAHVWTTPFVDLDWEWKTARGLVEDLHRAAGMSVPYLNDEVPPTLEMPGDARLVAIVDSYTTLCRDADAAHNAGFKDRAAAIDDVTTRLAAQIAGTKATGLSGLLAKARVAAELYGSADDVESEMYGAKEGTAERVALSILRDLLDLDSRATAV